MASIYSGSSLALVLDLKLMSKKLKVYAVPSKPNSPREMHRDCCAYIASSAWMSRSWTYQEGFLPTSVAFQFSQGLAVVSTTYPCVLADNIRDKAWRKLYTALRGPFYNFGHIRTAWAKFKLDAAFSLVEERAIVDSSGLPNSPSTTQICSCASAVIDRSTRSILAHRKQFNALVIACNKLAARSTSMPEDVIMILANSVSLESSGLARYHSMGDKLLALLLSLNRLPLSILYSSNSRHDQYGDRVNT
jgi:hypothetical protein